ncbi:hypothetical protein WA026_003406 [Henosepilachna vigintioctopunctata]|uniref:RRM domain-containing protein n=1 Tax=Henosepilachna vigintioctopunctata TaxID=420089 RepID=A0AAW1TMS3_9CUCU
MAEIGGIRLKDISHHNQDELCTSRPAYRQGRKLTSVKVFTIASESQHLYVYGVPKIHLRNELKSLFNKYGQILNIHVVADVKVELFTECFHIQYKRIQSARIAKRLVDNKSFYGGVLHVCYAPEHESLEETKLKLQQREKDVLSRLNKYNKEFQKSNKVLENDNATKRQLVDESSSLVTKANEASISHIYKEDEPILKRAKKSSQHNIEQYNLTFPNFSDNNYG